jgi:hypothetical protein
MKIENPIGISLLILGLTVSTINLGMAWNNSSAIAQTKLTQAKLTQAKLTQAKLTNSAKLSINTLGTVKVGMTVKEAAKAAGTSLIGLPGDQGSACYYLQPKGNLQKDVAFMITDGRIARIDIWSNKTNNITTLRGAKIGDSEKKIKSLYPGQIKVQPHNYVPGGHYLVFTPKDAANKNYRLVFETDGKVVTRYRSGKLPEVEYVEGCS